jgi:Tol biopolymer transport system component
MRTAIRVLCAAGILAALTPGGSAHAEPASTTPVNAAADGPSLSADGRYVAFWSSASDLVAGDTNRVADVFVRDRRTGETTRVSVDSAGVEGNNISRNPSLSADGRYVAFESFATNLVDEDTLGHWDVFVHDLQTRATTRISRARYGREAESDSLNPSISADGRFVAFDSLASNLVNRDWNIYRDVFVHDRSDGYITKASMETNGFESNGHSQRPSISADGRFVAFESEASNLALWPDTNRATDVFVHNRETRHTNRVSVSSANLEGDSASWRPSISADGRYVVYTSGATNLVPGDSPPGGLVDIDVFMFDRETRKTTQVNLAPDGRSTAWSSAHRPAISADGRFVAFQSAEDDLVPGDANGSWDVFVRDVVTKSTTRVSVDSAGAEANRDSGLPAMSADGRHVAFTSYATNLGAGSTFGYHLYVRDLGD